MTQEFAQPILREVLSVVAQKKATYATEVKWNTSISSIKKAGEILHILEDAGVVERLVPVQKDNDERLLDRRKSMWANDDKGLDDFRGKKWYGLNSDLHWELQPKGYDYVVDEYHDPVSYGETVDPDEIKGITEYASEAIN